MPQLLDTLITWNSAQRIARLIRRTQKRYIGQPVTETMPNGNEVAGVIVDMTWESSYGLEGGWAVYVQYESGYESWTSDTVLTLGAKQSCANYTVKRTTS